MELPTVVEPWLWESFLAAVLVFLCLDLFVFNRKAHVLKFKEAAIWSVFWVTLAVLFNIWFGFKFGSALGLEFATGYIVELSLSIDNLFVILLVFKSLRIQPQFQHRVLFWGILGAIIFRGLFIIIGVDLLNKFSWILYVFGVILIASAIKFLFESDEKKDITDSWAVKTFKKFVPMTKNTETQKFFIVEDGIRKATPLFLALIVIEFTDIIFAVDSIPAVLAVTRDAFVAFASNVLALLGLRSLYFVIADWVERFRYLKPGLAAILGFVGVKMLIIDLYHIPSWVSLTVIVMILLTAGLTSWYASRKSILTSNPSGGTTSK
ncbi:MAG: TerC family protein [Bdellovibrionales bacterium]|nr:TerC family protein [Bdellovibrionales bacterium]